MKSPLEFWVFLPQMRLTMEQLVERARAAEAGGVRRRGRHGSPDSPSGREPAHVRSDDHEHVARQSYRAPSGRVTRPLRLLPAPGRSGTRSGLHRPCLGRALRARDRLGLGRGRTRNVRRRVTGGKGPTRPATRIARDHQSALDRRSARLRGRTLQLARCTTGTRPNRDGSQSSSGEPARGRCSWSPRTPTGGTCTPTSSTSSTRCGRSQETHAVRSRRRSHSSRPRVHATRSKRRRVDVSGRLRSSAPRPSSSTTSARSRTRGVERVYVWFCDFAAPETLAAFGAEVIGQFDQSHGNVRRDPTTVIA